MAAIVVTGATGFLGGHVIAALQAGGADVVAIGRDPARCAALEEAGARVIRHDIERAFPEAVADAIGPVDAVVHAAALSAPFGAAVAFERANVAGTRHVADLAARLGCRRFVLVSTPAVYFRFADQLGIDEAAPLPAPVNAYARTKRQAETIVLARPELGPVVLRPRGLYGRGDTALLPRLIRAAARGPLPLMRDGIAATDITHVDDVVGAVLAALAAPAAAEGQIINVSGGVGLTVRTIVERVGACTGLQVRWRALPVGLVMTAARLAEALARLRGTEPVITPYAAGLFAYSQTLALARADALLGWRPAIGFDEGLARTFGTGA